MGPSPEDLRKFSVAVLSWIGPLLVARRETMRVLEKDVNAGQWKTEEMIDAKSAVTSTDLESQRKILEQIYAAFPDHSVIGEEEDEGSPEFPEDADTVWLVDPLDGTANYAKGSEHFGAILGVASREKKRLLAGAIVEPLRASAFSFAAGRGAFRDKEPFTIRQPQPGAPILVGNQVSGDLIAELEAEFEHPVRRALSCAVAATIRLLEGEAVAYVGNNSDRLDMAAPLSIVQAARGRVTDWDGKPLSDWLAPRYRTFLATSDPVLLEEIVELTSGLS